MTKVIDAIWFNGMSNCTGIVITIDDEGVKRAFVGAAVGDDEQKDIQRILDYGCPLSLFTIKRIKDALEHGS